MSYETLTVEVIDRLAVVTINRPEVRNALSRQVLADLRAALAALRDDHEVGAVAFTGAGDKAFIAGAGDGDGTDLVVVAQHRQRGAEVGKHLPAQRVAHLRTVDGDDGEPVGHLDGQRLVAHDAGPGLNAGMPVMARPMISVWISSVPS